MATKKKGNNKQNTAAARKHNAELKEGKRQLVSVLLFAFSIFLLCVVFIKGQNVWTYIHNAVFWLFGIVSFLVPFYLGAIAVALGLDKLKEKLKVKIIETGILIYMLSVAIDVFFEYESKLKFFGHIAAAGKDGILLKSGGALAVIFGHPLEAAFGAPGAHITIILLIFVFLMIITGTSIAALFRLFMKPVRKISENAQNQYEEKSEKEKKLKVIKGFDVDIPVDDMSKEIAEQRNKLTPEQKKVVSTYFGEDIPEEPAGTEDKDELNSALDETKREAIVKEQMKTQPAETINFTEETEKFTNDLNNSEEQNNVYVYPPLNLLNKTELSETAAAGSELTAEHLVETLKSFGVETRIVNISRGPTVTRYELQPCAGVKISKITNLADDIALNLATAGVRIEAPIPNKAAVGIEVPNKSSDIVSVRGIFESPEFMAAKSKLTVALGRDIGGNPIVADISKMPHGLIAGATGSGKSVCINTIIMSILYKATPDEVKLLMIDPKVVELGIYNGIPHLLVPVVTDPRKASGALGWAVTEMEKRYRMFADRGVRDLAGYNKFVETLPPDSEVEKMPHIVIIIDELADLMMTAPNEVEDSINRIAAKARAAGMHLIIATQRPSVDVVTGVIKANIPTRIAFAVSSQIDSRTILDSAGAEKLLGRGDMLFSPVGSNKPNRIQGCYVSDEEVEAVVSFVKGDKVAEYDDDVMVEIERQAAVEKKQKTGLPEDGPSDDPMLEDAIKVVVENGLASTSLLQRKLKLGYARAARIIDEMESRGIVGGYEGSKPRKVLITKEQLMERELAATDE